MVLQEAILVSDSARIEVRKEKESSGLNERVNS